MYDLIIKNANIFGGGAWLQKSTDIAIKDGKNALWKKNLHHSLANEYFDARDMLVTPALINTHINLDKSYINSEVNATDFAMAQKEYESCVCERYKDKTDEEIKSDIYDRSKKAVQQSIVNGVTTIRNFSVVDNVYKTLSFESAQVLKEEFAERVKILNGFYYAQEHKGLCDELIKNHSFDAIASEINDGDDYKGIIDKLIELSLEHSVSICFDFNQTDKRGLQALLYLCNKIHENCLQHMVTCAHLRFLRCKDIPQNEIDTAVAIIARARLNVEVMPSTDINLGAWETRGVTVVKTMLEQGVALSLAVDNIRNVFSPFGTTNMLRELLLLAQALKMSTHHHFSQLLELVTFSAAEVLFDREYGIEPRLEASYVVFSRENPTQAIIAPCEVVCLINKGSTIINEKG